MTRRPLRDVRVYEVGGAVRDTILGRAVSDRDWVVVGATPEMMTASGYTPVGSDFPVFLHPQTHEEYALARTERKHGTGYRGFEFFASPEVTLEQDLERRDLTINAMARDEQGNVIDPFGGRRDLESRVLRHVSPAFAEDPLRVLRVARFAARLGFAVAPPTLALMRKLARSGELATVSPERVWRELSTGLMESEPSRMLRVLRACGALDAVLPETAALFDVRLARGRTLGAQVLRALDGAAHAGRELAVRYAVLSQRAAGAKVDAARAPKPGVRKASRTADAPGRASASSRPWRVEADAAAARRTAEGLSARLKVPLDCRDAAMLAARFRLALQRFDALTPAGKLDVVVGCDALRRPERLAWVAQAALADADADARHARADDVSARIDQALAARDLVAAVDAAAIARAVAAEGGAPRTRGDRVAAALRRARLAALRKAPG